MSSGCATLMNIVAFKRNQQRVAQIENMSEKEKDIARELGLNLEVKKITPFMHGLAVISDLGLYSGPVLVGKINDYIFASLILLGTTGEVVTAFNALPILFSSTDITSKVNSYIKAQEEKKQKQQEEEEKVAKAKEVVAINSNSKRDRVFSIGNLQICIHSVETIEDFKIVDISIVNNYSSSLWLNGNDFHILSGDKVFNLSPGVNIGEKYSNATLLSYLEDKKEFTSEISTYATKRGYLIFESNKNENLKLVFGISLKKKMGYTTNEAFENIEGKHSLDISGIGKPKGTDCPLKILRTVVNYFDYLNHLQISLQNISNKTIRAFAIKAAFYNDFGNKVREFYTRFVSQKLSFEPWERDYFTWVLSEDTITKAEIYIDEVVFTDGTKWEAK